MSNMPLVSILCVTYNQEKYLREAIDSFLMQKTNFEYEIIIHDDASTDGTIGIIQAYASRHPGVIRPIYEKTNQFSQGKVDFVKEMFVLTKGEYIAACEGDDFWTNPEKLQKQVDFLEKNKDYALCFHPVRVFFEGGEEKDSIFPSTKSGFTVGRLLKDNFIQSNSVMYRKQEYMNLASDITPADWYTHLYHAQFGKIGFVNEVMSAYRRHTGGIWWDAAENKDQLWIQYGMSHLKLFGEFQKMYKSEEYTQIIDTQKDAMFDRFIDIDSRQGTQLLEEAINQYPGDARQYLVRLNSRLHVRESRLHEIEKNSIAQQNKIEALENIVNELKQTKVYRAKKKVKRAIRGVK